MRHDKTRAFTLIELLVVIAIIALLSGLIMVVFSRAEAKAQQVVCMSNLHQLVMADLMYAQDYHGYFPPYENIAPGPDCYNTNDGFSYPSRCAPESLHEALTTYVEDNRVWFCPNDPIAGQIDNNHLHYPVDDHRWSSYFFSGSFINRNSNISIQGFIAIHPNSITKTNKITIMTPSQCFLINDSGNILLRSEDNLHFNGSNIAFIDGHLKWIPIKTN